MSNKSNNGNVKKKNITDQIIKFKELFEKYKKGNATKDQLDFFIDNILNTEKPFIEVKYIIKFMTLMLAENLNEETKPILQKIIRVLKERIDIYSNNNKNGKVNINAYPYYSIIVELYQKLSILNKNNPTVKKLKGDIRGSSDLLKKLVVMNTITKNKAEEKVKNEKEAKNKANENRKIERETEINRLKKEKNEEKGKIIESHKTNINKSQNESRNLIIHQIASTIRIHDVTAAGNQRYIRYVIAVIAALISSVTQMKESGLIKNSNVNGMKNLSVIIQTYAKLLTITMVQSDRSRAVAAANAAENMAFNILKTVLSKNLPVPNLLDANNPLLEQLKTLRIDKLYTNDALNLGIKLSPAIKQTLKTVIPNIAATPLGFPAAPANLNDFAIAVLPDNALVGNRIKFISTFLPEISYSLTILTAILAVRMLLPTGAAASPPAPPVNIVQAQEAMINLLISNDDITADTINNIPDANHKDIIKKVLVALNDDNPLNALKVLIEPSADESVEALLQLIRHKAAIKNRGGGAIAGNADTTATPVLPGGAGVVGGVGRINAGNGQLGTANFIVLVHNNNNGLAILTTLENILRVSPYYYQPPGAGAAAPAAPSNQDAADAVNNIRKKDKLITKNTIVALSALATVILTKIATVGSVGQRIYDIARPQRAGGVDHANADHVAAAVLADVNGPDPPAKEVVRNIKAQINNATNQVFSADMTNITRLIKILIPNNVAYAAGAPPQLPIQDLIIPEYFKDMIYNVADNMNNIINDNETNIHLRLVRAVALYLKSQVPTYQALGTNPIIANDGKIMNFSTAIRDCIVVASSAYPTAINGANLVCNENDVNQIINRIRAAVTITLPALGAHAIVTSPLLTEADPILQISDQINTNINEALALHPEELAVALSTRVLNMSSKSRQIKTIADTAAAGVAVAGVAAARAVEIPSQRGVLRGEFVKPPNNMSNTLKNAIEQQPFQPDVILTALIPSMDASLGDAPPAAP